MNRYVPYLAAVLAPAAYAQVEQPMPGADAASGVDLLGTWQACGNARIDVRDTNPRGIENLKLVFRPDATVELRPAEASGSEGSEFGRFESTADGIRLLVGGRELGVLKQRGSDAHVLTRDDGEGLLICRLGDIAAAGRKLQPRSVAFYRSRAFDDPGIARNIEARRPPAGSLLGTWELARVVVHDSAQSWFGSNPDGSGHVRLAFHGREVCLAALWPQWSEMQRGCLPAQVRGLQVRTDRDAGELLAPWVADTVQVTADGVMRVPRRGFDEEFVWLGPDDLTQTPLEGRITLVKFSEEDD
ncbi:MAG: hypothetical protein ABW163_01425 [Luteimonas sp.]